MKEEKTYAILNGILIDIETMGQTRLLPSFKDGEFNILVPDLHGPPESVKEHGVSVTYSHQGTRRPHGISWKSADQGYGYVKIESAQLRVDLQKVTTWGGEEIVGIVRVPTSRFSAPLPLATLEDAKVWRARGFNSTYSAARWAKALQWKGFGAKQSAEAVKLRCDSLSKGIRLFPEIPSVLFPEPIGARPLDQEGLEITQQLIGGLMQRVDQLEKASLRDGERLAKLEEMHEIVKHLKVDYLNRH